MLKRKPKDLFLLQKLWRRLQPFCDPPSPTLFLSIVLASWKWLCVQSADRFLTVKGQRQTDRQTDVGNSRWKHQINFRSYLKVELILHPDKLRFNKICFWNFWQVRRTPKELFNLFCFWRNTNYNCSYYVLPT
jgi:hypothetical protein